MLTKLKAIQKREGWTDADMSERLGIARSTWTDTRNGHLPFSPRLQMAAARAFPELVADLLGQVGMGHADRPVEAA